MGTISTIAEKVKEAVRPRPSSQDIATALAKQREESAECARAMLDDDSDARHELYAQSKSREARLEAKLKAACDVERQEKEDAERERLAPIIAELDRCVAIASERYVNAHFETEIAHLVDDAILALHRAHQLATAVIAEQSKAVERARELAKQLGRSMPVVHVLSVADIYELARRLVRQKLLADPSLPQELASMLTASRG